MFHIPTLLLAAAATISGSLTCTLPSREAGDSLCSAALTPCTDLDSIFLDRQDPTTFRQLTTIKRASVRGLEGQPWTFTYSCDTPPCQYDVWTKDVHGNESCPSAIVQVGGTTGVPIGPRRTILVPEWFDLQGRRVDPRDPVWRQGLYFTHWRDSLVVR